MSGAAARMRAALNATGSYRLTGAASADWEGEAAAVGLDEADDFLTALFGDLFAPTAGEAGLALWEETLQLPPADALEDRRRVLAARLSCTPERFRMKDLPLLLLAAGVEGTAAFSEEGVLNITVTRLLGATEEEAKRALSRLLPAHVPFALTGLS